MLRTTWCGPWVNVQSLFMRRTIGGCSWQCKNNFFMPPRATCLDGRQAQSCVRTCHALLRGIMYQPPPTRMVRRSTDHRIYSGRCDVSVQLHTRFGSTYGGMFGVRIGWRVCLDHLGNSSRRPINQKRQVFGRSALTFLLRQKFPDGWPSHSLFSITYQTLRRASNSGQTQQKPAVL